VKTDDGNKKDSEWLNKPYTNLVRYQPSQIYFARFRVKGKLIRRRLKTNLISVAKIRLAEMQKVESAKAESFGAVAAGKMTFRDALTVFQSRFEADPAHKPRTKEYCRYRVSALLKSWPGLAEKDVSRITPAECQDWSVRNAAANSSSSHNYTVSILRRVFAIAVESGARYDNPAAARPPRKKPHPQTDRPAGIQAVQKNRAARGGVGKRFLQNPLAFF
jgi:hypothetical protein